MASKKSFCGLRYGLLTAICPAESTSKGYKWKWKCDCGRERVCYPHVARATEHCGCKTQENLSRRPKKHGQHGTLIYRIWDAMKQRCLNPKTKHYDRYGGRGITVCERWLEFGNFLEDMGSPQESQTIDRIDNNGNYEPGNCRWATRKEQSRNNSRNRVLTFSGQSLPLICWAEQIGIPIQVLRSRLNRGWSTEKTLTTKRLSRGAKNHGVI